MTKNQICDLFAVAMLIMTIAAATAIAQTQTFAVLHNFGTRSVDLDYPGYPGMIAQGRDGNLYSTGAGGGKGAAGGIFKITPTGTFTVLQSLNVTDGNAPESGLTLATDGNFYGAAQTGGNDNAGVIFKITPSGSLRVLYNAPSGADESYPLAGPIQGTDGNFYGTTEGNPGGQVGGTVYKLTPSGIFTALYSFPSDRLHGAVPLASVVQGVDGNFYGTTEYGGKNNAGIVFKITPAGHLTVLYNFDGAHGAAPYAPVIQGNDGSFYGTTFGGGTNGDGVVFKITPGGKLTVLHNFNGTDGANPTAGLVQATDVNFYGVTKAGGTLGEGTIYKISPHGSYSVLYNFDGTTGTNPEAMLVQHTTGILYGDAQFGGTCTQSGGCGTFYSLKLGLNPFVSLVSTSGKVGKTIEILGQGFTSSTTVSFNGTAATPSVKSGTYLTAAVPNGATTGFVTVTTSGVTLKSNKKFRLTPQITSFTPTSGTVGTVVTITGVSLNQTTKVTFGGVKATTVTVVNDTQVKATVPSGAVTGKIAITTPGGTAVSSGVFTVK
jgi:uncharacterized repeat protein (TIGR03803 family)